MPFIYNSNNKMGAQALENLATSAGGNTELDFFFLKPGASRPVSLIALRVQGKGSQLTALSGISIRIKEFTGGAATTVGGTSVTPQQKHNLAPAVAASAGLASVAGGTITSGTTPFWIGLASMGGSGPGGWVAINPDDVPALDGGAAKSIDLVSSTAPAVALSFEFSGDHQEA